MDWNTKVSNSGDKSCAISENGDSLLSRQMWTQVPSFIWSKIKVIVDQFKLFYLPLINGDLSITTVTNKK